MIKIYSIQQQPFYDSHHQAYRQILTINTIPEGPLNNRVRRINNPKLSPFQFPPPQSCPPPSCINAIYDDCGQLLCIDNLPSLFQYLIENGYIFDYELTNMMEKSRVITDGTLLCYIKYEKK